MQLLIQYHGIVCELRMSPAWESGDMGRLQTIIELTLQKFVKDAFNRHVKDAAPALPGISKEFAGTKSGSGGDGVGG